MDRRKNNGGHSTKGFAGRKPKADEIKIIELMDSVADSKEVWQKLLERVELGDVQAIKTWLAYRYGQPKQTIDQHNTHEINQVVWQETKTYLKNKEEKDDSNA